MSFVPFSMFGGAPPEMGSIIGYTYPTQQWQFPVDISDASAADMSRYMQAYRQPIYGVADQQQAAPAQSPMPDMTQASNNIMANYQPWTVNYENYNPRFQNLPGLLLQQQIQGGLLGG